MKFRNLIVAVCVLGALAGTLYWSEHRKAPETAKASADTPPAIIKLNESTITGLELKKLDTPPLVLEKNGSGDWQISQPRALSADQSAVSGTISTLSSLNSERLVENKASDLKQYGLDQPAVEVDIAEKDNKAQKLLIGDETPAGSAYYAMLGGDPRIFTIAGYTKSSIDKTLNDLRDKRLLTVSADKVSRLELDRKDQTIEFGRDKDEWQILKPAPLRADSVQVGELVSKLADARMDLTGSASNGSDAASAFAKGKPVATAKLTSESGSQELQLRKNKDSYYAKSSIMDGTYKVGSDLGQAVDKGLDDFRNKKLFDFGYSDPSRIEMHDGSTAYFLTRGGQDWWSNGKKMDADAVQSYLSDVRDLSASKFVTSGFAKPAIDLTVTSGDGKRVEKVSIAKAGGNYIARREGEPSLYQLDSSAVDEMLKAAGSIKPAPTSGK